MVANIPKFDAEIELSQPVTPKGYDHVVDFLSEQMQLGKLKVGDRLLPERELAIKLNISRPVVREALRSLSMIGVLEIQQGRGTFVRAPDFSALGHLFTFMFIQSGEALDDIMELRQAIELQAIRLACARARSQDIARIGDAMEQIRATIDDADAGGMADFDFHSRIVDASHSTALINIHAIVSRILRDNHVQRRRRIAMGNQLHSYVVDHHEELYRAIVKRDADDCARLLTLHFAIGDKLSADGAGSKRTPAS